MAAQRIEKRSDPARAMGLGRLQIMCSIGWLLDLLARVVHLYLGGSPKPVCFFDALASGLSSMTACSTASDQATYLIEVLLT